MPISRQFWREVAQADSMSNLFIFLDETYPKEARAEAVAVAAVAVFESQWPSLIVELRRIAGLGSKRRFNAIREFFQGG
jgi:hypothetical protein